MEEIARTALDVNPDSAEAPCYIRHGSEPRSPIKKAKSGVNITQDDTELLSLLGYYTSHGAIPSAPSSSRGPLLPPLFRAEIERRLAEGQISSAVAHYYLNLLSLGDSRQVPGQSMRPSLLEAVLTEDVHNLSRQDTPGYGWRPIGIIGKGAYGCVILWEKRQRYGRPIRLAVKDSLCSSFFKDYCSEGHLTRRLNDIGSKNVINVVEWKYIDPSLNSAGDGTVIRSEPKNRICFEYAEYSDLRRLEDWYRLRRLILPEAFIWHVLCSMACALFYCRHGTASLPYKAGWDAIVHGDVKQANIFMTVPDEETNQMYPCIKLADFGFAYTLGGSMTAVQHYRSRPIYGTDGYIAPEIEDQTPETIGRRRLPSELHGPHSDIYSLGMTCKNLLSLVDLHKPAETRHKRSKSGFEVPPGDCQGTTTYYSTHLRVLLDRCTAQDPRNRPKTSKLYQEAKAQMGLHLAMAKTEAAAARRECGARFFHSQLLYTPEDQVRYDTDLMFRDHYSRVNLSQLQALLEEKMPLRESSESPSLLSKHLFATDKGKSKPLERLVRALLRN